MTKIRFIFKDVKMNRNNTWTHSIIIKWEARFFLMLHNKNYWSYCLPLVIPGILNSYKIFILHFVYIHLVSFIFILKNWEVHSVTETKTPYILFLFFFFSHFPRVLRCTCWGKERKGALVLAFFFKFSGDSNIQPL